MVKDARIFTEPDSVADIGKDWLAVSEAARELGRSATQVRRLADSGKLKVRRTPLGRLISRASIVEYASAGHAVGRPPKEG